MKMRIKYSYLNLLFSIIKLREASFIYAKIILAARSANFSHKIILRKFVPAAINNRILKDAVCWWQKRIVAVVDAKKKYSFLPINCTSASLTLGQGDDFDT